MKPVVVLLILILIPSALFAKETDEKSADPGAQNTAPPSLAKNPVGLIGLDIPGIHRLFGAPDEVFAHRGEAPEYDDVVFFYRAKSFYLFLFENRVWVVRFDERYPDDFMGIAMGMSGEDVARRLGVQSRELEDSTVFFISELDFPVRLRCYFKENRLVDAYLYRGDF